MTRRELAVLLDGHEIARMRHAQNGRLSLRYDDAWRTSQNGYPLSLSMPLAADEYGHQPTAAFIWGLLPDNEIVLSRWARRFHVSARNPFALIAKVGEDRSGALQFVVPERIDELRAERSGAVEWLEERDVAARLRSLRSDQSAWRTIGDTGQFSLAGAQAKTALFYEKGRWGVPSGRIPTTHILKPPIADLAGHVQNEHFCLELARRLGLPAAQSSVRRFEGELAIVVERFDRVRVAQRVLRVHQEDMCQALAVLPTSKYESDGGPGVRAIVDLLREYSSAPGDDVATFIDAVAYNWLIAGTDAHAKNYGVLISGRGQVRLAPLYDLASVLPYDDLDSHKVRLAMKIGGRDRLRWIGGRQWMALAKDLRLDPEDVLNRVRRLVAIAREHADAVRIGMLADGLPRRIVDTIANRIASRAVECRDALASVRP